MIEEQDNLQQRLVSAFKLDPVEPSGWFRKIYNRFAVRQQIGRENYKDRLKNLNFHLFVYDADLLVTPRYKKLWLEVLERHAWTFGVLEVIEPVVRVWRDLSLQSRGAFLAGFSSSDSGITDINAVTLRIRDAEFSAVSCCELACNLMLYRCFDGLNALLSAKADWLSPVDRLDANAGFFSGDDIFNQLSKRPIDILLEASLCWESLEGVRAALTHGADPNIPILVAERSSSEKHCPLSYAIAEGLSDIARLLLDSGASPEGNSFGSTNSPLFRALQSRKYSFAEELIALGVCPSAVIDQSPDRDYSWANWGYRKSSFDWVEERIAGLIPFVPVTGKPVYYVADAQGGQFYTLLSCIFNNPDLIKRFKEQGLDTRLCIEEFCIAVDDKACKSLYYLLEQYGDAVREQVIQIISEYQPAFRQRV